MPPREDLAGARGRPLGPPRGDESRTLERRPGPVRDERLGRGRTAPARAAFARDRRDLPARRHGRPHD